MDEKTCLVGYFEENVLALGKKGTCISSFISLLPACMLWKKVNKCVSE